ncbi:MAG: hypothetical protein ABI823_17170, partial [Bryobacteraceae bacterium]
RHQTRLHRMHLELVRRMDALIDKRDHDSGLPDSNLPDSSSDDQQRQRPEDTAATSADSGPDDPNPSTTGKSHHDLPGTDNNPNDMHAIGSVLKSPIAGEETEDKAA